MCPFLATTMSGTGYLPKLGVATRIDAIARGLEMEIM
jgi:hypothetical protein